MVTVPSFRAVTVEPVIDTTVESLLSKLKELSPELDSTTRSTVWPTCLSGKG